MKHSDMAELMICRCEEVTLDSILDCVQQGACTAKEIKLRTRAGMGICQGRTCRPLIEGMLASLFPAAPVRMSCRSPIRPTLLCDLAALPHGPETARAED
ncbi:(2Fe-2S)-binding protein [Brevibacillus sp. TJ4]|uniref:(2Fe-2S)-binding protein n=1 Tax=Brevibacillus sp. TJ4 TaxID=3234853 RepID=UPI0037D38D25